MDLNVFCKRNVKIAFLFKLGHDEFKSNDTIKYSRTGTTFNYESFSLRIGHFVI